MNIFDSSVIHFVNQFANKSKLFDNLMIFIVDNNILKGVFMVAILYFLWFQKSDRLDQDRRGVITTIASTLIAIAVGRLLVVTLPFRVRPILSPAVHFIQPYAFKGMELGDMSSFPSDHAVMFSALATGVYLVNKRVGIFTSIYVLAVILFPRLYLGYHFPTDIIAGILLGCSITYLLSRKKISMRISNPIMAFSVRYPGIFYALSFLFLYEMGRMFAECRKVVGLIIDHYGLN